MDRHVLTEDVAVSDSDAGIRGVGIEFEVLRFKPDAHERVDPVVLTDLERAGEVIVPGEARTGADSNTAVEGAMRADDDVVGQFDFGTDGG